MRINAILIASMLALNSVAAESVSVLSVEGSTVTLSVRVDVPQPNINELKKVEAERAADVLATPANAAAINTAARARMQTLLKAAALEQASKVCKSAREATIAGDSAVDAWAAKVKTDTDAEAARLKAIVPKEDVSAGVDALKK